MKPLSEDYRPITIRIGDRGTNTYECLEPVMTERFYRMMDVFSQQRLYDSFSYPGMYLFNVVEDSIKTIVTLNSIDGLMRIKISYIRRGNTLTNLQYSEIHDRPGSSVDWPNEIDDLVKRVIRGVIILAVIAAGLYLATR
jgi:hypothetical protein